MNRNLVTMIRLSAATALGGDVHVLIAGKAAQDPADTERTLTAAGSTERTLTRTIARGHDAKRRLTPIADRWSRHHRRTDGQWRDASKAYASVAF